MEFVFSAIEGSFGAILMVLLTLGGFVGLFVGAVVALIAAIQSQARSWKFYAACLGLPIISLAGGIGVFILRSLVAIFFSDPIA